jgi:hypothetical protein
MSPRPSSAFFRRWLNRSLPPSLPGPHAYFLIFKNFFCAYAQKKNLPPQAWLEYSLQLLKNSARADARAGAGGPRAVFSARARLLIVSEDSEGSDAAGMQASELLVAFDDSEAAANFGAPAHGMAGGGWQSESMKNLMKQLGIDPVVPEDSEESRSQVPALFALKLSALWRGTLGLGFRV